MSMDQELLLWVRGTGLQIAAAVFVLGMSYRMLHLLLLGRKKSLAEARGSEWSGGLRTMWQRSFVLPRLSARGKFTVIAGYVFHLGFFITLFFLSQHIDLFRAVLGLHWPALPRGVIDIAAALSIAAMVALLVHRYIDPVKRLLSDYQDYLTWLLSFLPLLTGFMLLREIGFEYVTLLTLHILSVELLLIVAPFTKLAHMFTTFIARWYNGAVNGFKGIQA
jgi:nitrate reductase gamma subunit